MRIGTKADIGRIAQFETNVIPAALPWQRFFSPGIRTTSLSQLI